MTALRRNSRLKLAAGVLATGLVAAACGGSSGGSSASGTPSGAASTSGGGGGSGSGSAVGITANSITVGNVAVLSGPVPGLFQGAPYGVDSYFAMINSQGGVNGRMLHVTSADDALNCNQNSQKTKGLMDSVFAFVGNFSIFDDCGAAALAQDPTVPDVSFALGEKTKALPNSFSPQPQPPGYGTAIFTYLKQKFPDATKVGGFYGPGAAEVSWNYQMAAAKSIGFTVAYARSAAPTETSFTSDILRMRQAGVNFLDLQDFPVTNIVRVLQEAQQQNWHPTVIFAPTAYDGNFFKLLGSNASAAEGLIGGTQFAMFLGEDRATTPGVDQFLTWVNKTHPGFHPDLYTMYGWTSANLFVDALKKAGKNPTRASLLDALKTIHSFDANGMLAAADVGAQKPPLCFLEWVVHDGKFVRTLPKDKGFYCGPGAYFYEKK